MATTLRRVARIGGVSLLALVAAAGAAAAQEARDASVLRKIDTFGGAPGLEVGGLRMSPGLEVGAEYDDNIYRTKSNKKDDLVLRARPSVTISTDDWFPVNASISAFGEIGRYVQYSGENYEEFGTAASMSWDLHEEWAFDVNGSVLRDLQRRGLDVDNTSDRPTIVWEYEAGAGIRYQGDPFAFRFSPTYRRYDFLDSGGQNNDDRDRQEYLLDFRFAYKVGANTTLFVDPSYIWVRYDDPVDDFGFNQDSQGYEVRVGVGYDVSTLIYIEAGVGYFHRNYRDSRLGSENGLSALGRFYWNPTETLSFEGEVTRGISESDATQTGGSSGGAVATGAKLRAGWAVADNIVLDTGIGYYRYNYNDQDRTDNFYLFDVGARWYLNEYLYTTVRYAHEWRNSNVNSLDYHDNRFILTIGGQL
ncbi:MAG: outer membrane beta-barrel protein [Reyranellaceae bacterium]